MAKTQGREIAFPEPEPWPETVNGEKMLDALAAVFERFLVLPPGASAALALWVMHAYALDAFMISPILAVTSPTKRCGKTTLLALLAALVPRPLLSSNVSPAALFRVVEKFSPTLLVDEVDTFLGLSDELRGMLNASHVRASAVVVRVTGEQFEPRAFSTWSPKAVALIGSLPGPTEDRSIGVRMQRRAPGEKIDRVRLDRLHGELEPLRRQAARWAADHLDDLRNADPPLPEALNDRQMDNWRGLVAIADAVGGWSSPWRDRAREAAVLLSSEVAEVDTAAAIKLLSDTRAIFTERQADRLSSEDLVAALVENPEAPWAEWHQGRPLTQRGLARLLRPFGVRPAVVRAGAKTPRGYLLEDLADAFDRYLPPEPGSDPQHPQQAASDAGSGAFSQVQHDSAVADAKNDENRHGSRAVAHVADENPVLRRETPNGDLREPLLRVLGVNGDDGLRAELAACTGPEEIARRLQAHGHLIPVLRVREALAAAADPVVRSAVELFDAKILAVKGLPAPDPGNGELRW